MDSPYFKMEIFIPESHFSLLQEALRKVDAGHIGNYDSCLSFSRVTGMWRPLPGTDPYLGKENEICTAEELKVEVTVREHRLEETLRAVKEAHPYEEPVINVIPLFRTGMATEGESPVSNLTTLCYVEKDGAFLMLHRTAKENDINKEKWIGVGGHFEEDESPVDCLLREVREETGLRLLSWHFHGVVTFISDRWQTEYMFLYTADQFEGELIDCDEGELKWVPKENIRNLHLWEGDRIFLKYLMKGEDFGSLKLRYVGDELIEVNGKAMSKI